MRKRTLTLLALLLLVISISTQPIAAGDDQPAAAPQPAPFINAVTPGEYKIHLSYQVKESPVTITVMLQSIEVQSDLTLKFNFQWSAWTGLGSYNVTKQSDKLNKLMYVMDDKDNRYDHFDGDGAAYRKVSLSLIPKSGAFYFPKLAEDATSMTFFDGNQGKMIGPIEVRW